MNFVMSYSCGKDSTLALHKMIEQGHKPVALLVMVNEKVDRSFFHGADYVMLEAYSKCLELPLLITPAEGENYHLAMEESLRKAKAMGAEAACFGDIDIEVMRDCGIDICGENGEYRTLVVDGPIFKHPLPYQTGEVLDFGDFSIIDVYVEPRV